MWKLRFLFSNILKNKKQNKTMKTAVYIQSVVEQITLKSNFIVLTLLLLVVLIFVMNIIRNLFYSIIRLVNQLITELVIKDVAVWYKRIQNVGSYHLMNIDLEWNNLKWIYYPQFFWTYSLNIIGYSSTYHSTLKTSKMCLIAIYLNCRILIFYKCIC